MNQKERDVQRKLRILKHAEDGGSAVKTCPYLGVGRASFYCGKVLYKNNGEAGLIIKKPITRILPMGRRRRWSKSSASPPSLSSWAYWNCLVSRPLS